MELGSFFLQVEDEDAWTLATVVSHRDGKLRANRSRAPDGVSLHCTCRMTATRAHSAWCVMPDTVPVRVHCVPLQTGEIRLHTPMIN